MESFHCGVKYFTVKEEFGPQAAICLPRVYMDVNCQEEKKKKNH